MDTNKIIYKHRCLYGGEPFSFSMDQHDLKGRFLHTLLIEGCCRVVEGLPIADIDNVWWNDTDIKRLLDVNGGLTLVYIEANKWVRDEFCSHLMVVKEGGVIQITSGKKNHK